MITPFDYYFSSQALELAQWAVNEPDREKGCKLMQIAQSIEYRTRRTSGFPVHLNVHDYGNNHIVYAKAIWY